MHCWTSVRNEQFGIKQEEGDDTPFIVAIPHEPADMSCDSASNPSDPDASCNAHKGPNCDLGHMAQIFETYAEVPSRKGVWLFPG